MFTRCHCCHNLLRRCEAPLLAAQIGSGRGHHGKHVATGGGGVKLPRSTGTSSAPLSSTAVSSGSDADTSTAATANPTTRRSLHDAPPRLKREHPFLSETSSFMLDDDYDIRDHLSASFSSLSSAHHLGMEGEEWKEAVRSARAEAVSDVFRMHTLHGYEWIDIQGTLNPTALSPSLNSSPPPSAVVNPNSGSGDTAAVRKKKTNQTGDGESKVPTSESLLKASQQKYTENTSTSSSSGSGGSGGDMGLSSGVLSQQASSGPQRRSAAGSPKRLQQFVKPHTDLAFLACVTPILRADGVHEHLIKEAVRRVILPQTRVEVQEPPSAPRSHNTRIKKGGSIKEDSSPSSKIHDDDDVDETPILQSYQVPDDGAEEEEEKEELAKACCFVCRFPQSKAVEIDYPRHSFSEEQSLVGRQSKIDELVFSPSDCPAQRSLLGVEISRRKPQQQQNVSDKFRTDTVLHLTTRLTIFVLPRARRIITCHRLAIPILTKIRSNWALALDGHCRLTVADLVAAMVKACVESFVASAAQHTLWLDRLEAQLFRTPAGGAGGVGLSASASARHSFDRDVHLQNDAGWRSQAAQQPRGSGGRSGESYPRRGLFGLFSRRHRSRSAAAASVESMYRINRRASVFCRLLQPLPYAFAQLITATELCGSKVKKSVMITVGSTASPNTAVKAHSSYLRGQHQSTQDEELLLATYTATSPPRGSPDPLKAHKGDTEEILRSCSLLNQKRQTDETEIDNVRNNRTNGMPKVASSRSSDETFRILQDVVHSANNALSVCEDLRESSQSLLTLHFQLAANELEELVRVITLVSTIFIPLSFICALFGMGFTSWDPFFQSGSGLAVAVMAMLSALFLTWFWVWWKLL